MVILDLAKPLKKVLTTVQKIANKLYTFTTCTICNLMHNFNNQNSDFQQEFWLKLVQSVFSLVRDLSYFSSITSAITLAVSGDKPIYLGIRRIYELLILAKGLH